jgi:hypothetical protein
MDIRLTTSTKTRHVTFPRTPAGDLADRLLDPHFAVQYYKANGEADRMVNRLIYGRFTWFWRLWYARRS